MSNSLVANMDVANSVIIIRLNAMMSGGWMEWLPMVMTGNGMVTNGTGGTVVV